MSDVQQNLNDDIETIEEATHRLEERKWLVRRTIAIRSFFAIVATLVMTFGIFVFKEDITKFNIIEDVVITIILGLVSIIGFYFGASTWADIRKK